MIDFSNVTKNYESNIGLANASIHIDKSEFVFLVGPSGAGKTTFIKLIMKELDPDEGTITVNGLDIGNLSNRMIPQHRRKIGMVFQNFRLLPKKTVFENVAFAMEVVHTTQRTIKRQVPQLLELVGIGDKADKYPDELSAGEQQRVAIARALANNPPILICDEPTGNLDPVTAWEIMTLLDHINRRGTTVVMVTHAWDIVTKMKRRVISINDGRIINDTVGEYIIRKKKSEAEAKEATGSKAVEEDDRIDHAENHGNAADIENVPPNAATDIAQNITSNITSDITSNNTSNVTSDITPKKAESENSLSMLDESSFKLDFSNAGKEEK